MRLQLVVAALLLVGSNVTIQATKWLTELTAHLELATLISHVQDYFQSSNLVVVSDMFNEESLGKRTRLVHLLRALTKRSWVASTMLDFGQLSEYRSSCRERGVQPLMVVLLSDPRELEAFIAASRLQYPASESLWFLIFGPEAQGNLCPRPAGNPLDLKFDAKLLAKCADSGTIYEWYGLGGNRTESIELATWSSSSGSFRLLTRLSISRRRQDLAGAVLRVGILKESPFVRLIDGRLVGYMAEIVNELSETLNFRLHPRVREEIYYGSYDESSQRWTGVIGLLSRGEVDIGLDEFTMTANRIGAVDFSLPISRLKHSIFMRRPEGSSLQWSGYFRVYTFDSWMTISGMWLFTAAVITMIKMAKADRSSSARRLADDYFNIWGICWQQGLTRFPRAWSLRIAYWSILMKALVLYAIYSACLISYLTVSSPNTPFANIAEFVKDGSYNLITFRHGAHYELLMTTNDPLLGKLKNQMPPSDFLPETVVSGFKQLCYQKTALYSTVLHNPLIESALSCEVALLPTGSYDSIAITLVKRSQYTSAINYHLQRFREVGIIQRLSAKVKTKFTAPVNRYNAVNVQETAVVLSIFLVGCGLSVLILVVEITTYPDSKEKSNDKRQVQWNQRFNEYRSPTLFKYVE